ncbi:TPA: DEAD/DEAH box helicase family protein [Clostridium botulinum]|uniref:DEAD/DEAH box helicase family protein n=1 Tax=Clostridium botulinum TaxID=1491 RepID=UPI0007745C5D|nr:DEAD/DEAH box helicase family protein [Clostridium botulinum]HCL4470320.1 DEAD/DEAH box helicase family protein [Clostridium botulinum]HCL4485524.1 DEAD/DEAH box helicase family protein [Clostridium botulinum]HCL4496282.1 DEAD/DEAH box helicase family protein [Clostridium botulinum]HCL4499882.1 DEAD/DEAH box helicase family protein [Clostridium botulinum]
MGKKLDLEWVTQAIGEEYKKWNRGDIIKINAQTGTGKTYFIKNKLIPHLEEYENLLYICNRTNLKRQLKKDLLEQFGKEIPYIKNKNGQYKLKKGKRILDIKELDKITTIENVTITSYHAIQNSELDREYKINNFNTDYDYIVMDECHYIFADGSFNNKCRLAFDKLIKENYHFSIKIFISATMDGINDCINKSIEFILGIKPKIWTYTTKIDYSYVNTKYFKQIDDIIQSIKNDKSDGKWLVFVSDLNVGKKIIEEIGKDKSSLIKAGTRNNEELNNIINNSKFQKKVLVATKALDNGINISDTKLTNMVIMAWDKITFIQMLGRKRINIENAQEINLYIPTRYKKSFSSKINTYNKKRKEIELFNRDINAFNRKYDNDLDKIAKLNDLFYRDLNGEWKINKVGNLRLFLDMQFAGEMVKRFKIEGEFAFIYKQLEWIKRLDNFDEFNLIENVISNNEVESLEKYLEKIQGEKLFDEEQQELSNLIIKELITISDKVDYRTQKLKPSTIENILRNQLNLDYAVKSKRETKGSMRYKRYIIITKLK